MATTESSNIKVQGELFFCETDTKLANIVRKALELGKKHHEIVKAIKADLDRNAKAKKIIRIKDNEWRASRTEAFRFMESFEQSKEITEEEIILEQGRPRMPAELVLAFIQVRGYLGSVTGSKQSDQIVDSMTLRSVSASCGVELPSPRTILDNINAVSNETLELILNCQLGEIGMEKLDDFDMAIIDSTSVSADSAWPCESTLLEKLIRRIYSSGSKLEVFGVESFRDWSLPRWIEELSRLDFLINATTGKSGGKKKRRKLYKKLYRIVEKALARLVNEKELKSEDILTADLMPSHMNRLQKMWKQMSEDIDAAYKVLEHSKRRILEEEKIPSTEKHLSVSDCSAAMIVKGGRETIFGYKPQVVRTQNGFISSLIIEEGNISDSGSLVPAIEQHKQRTGVMPSQISTDDGYASGEGREQLLKLGAKRVSFSGGTGKTVMPADEWDADEFAALRNKRSSVESIIFTLKHVFELDHLRRRGIEAVRAEVLEKIIAHNFWRIDYLQRSLHRLAA